MTSASPERELQKERFASLALEAFGCFQIHYSLTLDCWALNCGFAIGGELLDDWNSLLALASLQGHVHHHSLGHERHDRPYWPLEVVYEEKEGLNLLTRLFRRLRGRRSQREARKYYIRCPGEEEWRELAYAAEGDPARAQAKGVMQQAAENLDARIVTRDEGC